MPPYDYRLCGVPLHLDSERPMKTDEFSERFGGAPSPDGLHFRIQTAGQLSIPPGELRGGSAERAAWQDGGWIYRCCRTHADALPYFQTAYRFDRPDEITCTVRAADWDWATRPQYL
ncbi:MAG: hypothetical protein ACI4PV_03150, partial [Butyricicoccus sp.]